MKKLLALLCLLSFLSPVLPHTKPNPPVAPRHVVLQLRWDHQYQFAGYYAANWQGFYREAGLEVEIRRAFTPEGEILSATEEVAAGRADFGVGGADILIAADRGADLCVISTLFQQSAARFYLKSETPYSGPSDLLQLRVARRVNDLIDVELQALLLSEGIDPQLVQPYPHQGGIEHLLTDQVQVIPGYETSIPYYAAEAGATFKTINPATYGIDFYGDSLFTRQKLVAEDADLVTRFISASHKGWDYALTHPEETADAIADRFDRIDVVEDEAAFNHFQAGVVRNLMLYSVVEIGHINPYRWEKMHTFLKEIGIVEGELNLDTFIFDPQKTWAAQAQGWRTMLAWILLLTAITGIVTVGWVTMLRQSVYQRTLELQRELALQKQAEAAQHESEVRLKKILEILPVGVWIMDKNGTITHCNPAGQHIWAGVRYVGPEQFGEYKAWRTATGEPVSSEEWAGARAIKGESFCEEELEIECFDGTHKIILNWAIPIPGEHQEIEGAVAINQDITDRKQAEAALRMSENKYRRLVENSPDIVYIFSSQCGGIYFSPRAAAVFGYPLEYLYAHPFLWNESIHPDDVAAVAQAIQQSADGTPFSVEYRVRNAQGAWRWLYDRSIERYVRDGATFIEGLATDITDRKQAEERVQQALREKEILLRELYHRTKNNMQVICAMLALQAARTENDAARTILHDMENRINTMALVHQKLYQTQDLSQIPLHDYIKELAELLLTSYQTQQRHIDLQLSLEPVGVLIDAAIPCGLILNELISNALKYAFTQRAQGTISIQLRVTEPDTIAIDFADDGVGVPPGFDFRGRPTLGLQSVIALVEHQLRGKIHFEGHAGVACHFHFANIYTRRV